MGHIVVLGSLHYDIIVRSTRRPTKGETLAGESWTYKRGGKGANQAVQAAGHGANVYMVGRVGTDDLGDKLLDSLRERRVDIDYVSRDATAGSGMSVAIIDAEGDYGAVIVSGVNQHVGAEDLARAAEIVASASLLVMQCEINLDTVTAAGRLAKQSGVRVLLNAAPAYSLSAELLGMIDYLVVNQVEAEMLTGAPVTTPDQARQALMQLRKQVPWVIITMGKDGVLYNGTAGDIAHLPAHSVKLVDAHGAGDSFIGALAAKIVHGSPLPEALRYANATAALVVSRRDSDDVQPDEVENLLQNAMTADALAKGLGN